MSDETATGPTPDDAQAPEPRTGSAASSGSGGGAGQGGTSKASVRRPQGGGRAAGRKAPAGEPTPQSAPRKPTSKRSPAKKTTPRKTASRETGPKTPAAPVTPAPEVPDQVLAEAAEAQPGSGEAPSLRELVAQEPTVRELAAQELAAQEVAAQEVAAQDVAAQEATPSAISAASSSRASAPNEPVAESFAEAAPEFVIDAPTQPSKEVAAAAAAVAGTEPAAPEPAAGPVETAGPAETAESAEPAEPVQEPSPELAAQAAVELADQAAAMATLAAVESEPPVTDEPVAGAPASVPAKTPADQPSQPQTSSAPTEPEPKRPKPEKQPSPAATPPAAMQPGAKGAQGAGYARDRFAALVGARVLRREKLPYTDALEIGAGATFGFSLGLLQSGVVNRLWISDLATSALTAARRRAEQLGLELAGDKLADPELLPFPEASFDLIIAHALLHRRMDPAGTITEILRVLRPGGRFVITGESTRARDWASPGFARAQGSVGRVGISRAGKARTRLPERLRTLTGAPDALPAVPDRLLAVATGAGAREVRVKPEELFATVLPYPGAEPAPAVARSRQRLAVLDRKLSQVLPAAAFPTVGLTGIR